MFANKTMESSSVTGATNPYTLGTPVGAFQAWRATVATTSVVFYFAENSDGSIWEYGWGIFTVGTPDQITRNVLGSSTGAAIVWLSTDAPIYVMSVPVAEILKHVALGGRLSALPAWAQRGFVRMDDSDANAWTTTRGIEKLYNGTAEAEKGRYEATPGIYVPSTRRPTLAVGAAALPVTVNHVGWRLTLDTAFATRALTLPAIATVDKGFMLSAIGLSAANGVVITPNGSEVVDFAAGGATVTIPGKVPFDIWSDGTQWRTNYVAAPPWAGVRQTVAAGPADTSGLPTFLPSTNAALSITSQNVSGSAPLVAAAANGWNAANGQAVDAVGSSTANLTWNGLTASRAAATPNFLYGTIAGGVITPASTILAPVYQWGGTPSTTSGQITFNISEMKAYLGNGATAPQTNLVLLGEAATDGSGVISTVAYAYNGRYDSGFTATLPGSGGSLTKNHNIGVSPGLVDFVAECTTTDQGYAVGDRLHSPGLFCAASTVNPPLTPWSSVKSMGIIPGASVPFTALVKNTGAIGNLTLASWQYKFIANRGW